MQNGYIGHINGEPFTELVLIVAYCPILLCLINVCDVDFGKTVQLPF